MTKEINTKQLNDLQFAKILACATCPKYNTCKGNCTMDKDKTIVIILDYLQFIDS